MMNLSASLPSLPGAVLSRLLDAGAKSFLILLLAAFISLLLRRRSAAMRHFVWAVALGTLLALPVLSAVLPGWPILPRWFPPRDSVRTAPSAFRVSGNPTSPIPPRPALVSQDAPPGEHVVTAPSTGVQKFPRAKPMDLAVPGLVLWLTGVLVVSVRTGLGLFSLSRLQRSAATLVDEPWLDLAKRLLNRLGIRRRVCLLVSPSRRMPMTWGLFPARLLLPSDSSDWPQERREAVLLHECAHIKRGDYLMNLLTQVVCALYWFNPLVWLTSRQLAIERELACDDIVLATGCPAEEYARELLTLAASPGVAAPWTQLATPMAQTSLLESRIRALLDGRRRRAALSPKAKFAALSAMALVIVPLTVLAVESTNQTAVPNSNAKTGSSPTEAVPKTKTRRFVRMVVALGEMTFEGQAAAWEQLPLLLEKLPARSETVLELAVATDTISMGQVNELQERVRSLSERFGFEYMSYVGVHPLGSKGSEATVKPTSEIDRPGGSQKVRQIEVNNQGLYQSNGQWVTLEKLEQDLIVAHAANPNLFIHIRADETVPSKHVIQLMDCLRKLKFNNVAFRTGPKFDTPPDDARAKPSDAGSILEKQAKEVGDKLKLAERALEEFKKNSTVSTDTFTPKMMELVAMEVQTEQKRIRLELDFARVKEAGTNFAALMAIPIVANDAEVLAASAQLNRLESDFATLKQTNLPKHPAYIRAEGALVDWRRNLTNATLSVPARLLAGLEQVKAQEKAYKAEEGELEKQALTLGQYAIRYNELQREKETLRAVYDNIIKRLKETSVSRKHSPSQP